MNGSRPHILKGGGDSVRKQDFKDSQEGDTEAKDFWTTILEKLECDVVTPSEHPDPAHYHTQLGLSFAAKDSQVRPFEDLKLAQEHFHRAVELTPSDHPNLPHALQNLGTSLADLYHNSQRLRFLESALDRFKQAIALTPAGYPQLAIRLQLLATCLTDYYEKLEQLEDIEAALENAQHAISLTPSGHPSLPQLHHTLGVSFAYHYQKVHSLQDLEASLQNYKIALQLSPEGHPDIPGYLRSLAVSHMDHYEEFHNLTDLESWVENDEMAFQLSSDRDPEMPDRLHSLVISYKTRYKNLGNLAELEASPESSHQRAIRMSSERHPEMSARLHLLAVLYAEKSKSSQGNFADLQSAIQNDQMAIRLTDEEDPNLPEYFNSLAASLRVRYHRTGGTSANLEAALEYNQRAIKLTPEGDQNLSKYLRSLAESYKTKYKALGYLADLQSQLENEEAAISLTSEESPDLAGHLWSVAICYTDRYKRSDNLSDLDLALASLQKGVQLTSDNDPNLPTRLHSLAVTYMDRYRKLGDLNDLQVANEHEKRAVTLLPGSHFALSDLTLTMDTSFHLSVPAEEQISDLEVALEKYQTIISMTSEGSPDLPTHLHSAALLNLSLCQGQPSEHLDNALEGCERAITLSPDRNPAIFHTFAIATMLRYATFGDLKDIQTAIERIWGPILSDATEDWDPCKTLTEHWKVTMIFKDRKDLEGALHSNEAAVQPRADLLEKLRNLGELFMHNLPSKDWKAQSSPLNAEVGQPDLIFRLQNLAVALTEQYEREGDQRALDTALFTYHTSFQGAIPDPAHAWSAAQRWASLTKLHKPDDCLRAYLCGFKLLPEIFWVGQPLSSRQQTLMEIDIATATSNAISASIDLSNLEQAVEFLDQGLATTFQQMLQLKATDDDLPPADAEKLQSLSSELYSGTSENAREIGKEWSGLLKVIEERATHQYRLGPKPFLGPKRFAELTEAAREGPVIILNSHEDHCDAIVVQHAAYSFNLLHVPLPDVSVKTLKHQRLILHELLGECNVRSRLLFFAIVSILNASLQDGNRGDRLWWCPTGAFTGFPLHAAAKSDRYIQSYTSSLSALIEAKGRTRSNSPRRVTVPTIGLVGVTHSGPGQYQSLPGVEKEIETIKSLLAEKYQVQSRTGEEATVEAVKLQLENCSWLHLACHGTQDLCNPPKSHLVLYEGILELETILRMPLSTAEFVFLAACETAKGSVDLVNESFHLCGGFIAAGFDGAIGTLWAMRDSDGPVVAEAVYSYLFKDNRDRRVTEAAKALHLAVRKMRGYGSSV
ncbi:CHAT domain-containing protein [Mycena rebaudengoi]|nr:CHAT domain-containing protein [Mycena rebaudengoi]